MPEITRDPSTRPAARSPRQAAVAALVGTTVEWYDFFIYATAAALVFRTQFFPAELSPLVGTSVAFATTSFGYLGRPIGAAIFGHLGDKVGRKATLAATILTMGVATFAIGLLPTYGTIGAAAPVILVLLRLAQGIAVGGEWGGAASLAVEHAPEERRTFLGSFAQVGSPVGALLSSGMFALSALVAGPLAGGSWRIPFLFSAVLIVVGLVIRLRVDESPEFTALAQASERSASPLREALARHRGTILLAAGAMFVATGGYYVTSSFWLVYATERHGLDESLALNVLTVGAAFEIAFTLLAGWLGDKVSPRTVVVVGMVAAAVIAPFWFAVGGTHLLVPILLLAMLIAATNGAHYGPMARFLTDLFPARVRYSATSVAYQLAALTAGALTPVAVSALFGRSHGEVGLVLVYLAALCGVAIVCAVFVWRRRVVRPALVEGSGQ